MELSLLSVFGIALSATCFVLAIFVFNSGKQKIHKIWALFNLCICIWGFGMFFIGNKNLNIASALSWWKFAHLGGMFIPVVFFHTVLELSSKCKRKTLILFYLQAVLFVTLILFNRIGWELEYMFNSFYYIKSVSYPYILVTIFWLVPMTWGFIILINTLIDSQGIQRNQLKYFLLGTIIGFVGGASHFFPVYGIKIYPFNITIVFYVLIATYAILRYRLMDINVVIKKALIYSLSAGILTSIFVIVALIATEYLSDLIGVSSFIITVIAALTIAVLFNPLKNKIQSILDRTFFIKTYDYYSAIQKVSQNLASMFDPKSIYNFVGDIIFSTVGLRNIYLLSVVPGGDFQVVYEKFFGQDRKREKKGIKIEGNSKIVQFLFKTNEIVIKDEMIARQEGLGEDIVERFIKKMKPFQGEAILPVFIDDKLEILCILGEKLSGNIFTDEDIKLLNTISHQTSIALKNAKLYSEKISSERLASIGMVSATFAHEVRNPLTSIKTFAQLMPEKYADAEFRENFSKIAIDEIGRIDRLIKDLMSISTKNVSIPRDEVDLYGLVDDILERVKVNLKLENREIRVEKLYKKDKITVIGDSQKLQQSFMNIINNGCQAMDDNGVLTVDIKPNGQNIDILITDIGKGIPPVEINKIFDPFYTTKDRGVGLGLAISKKIVEDHGGTMTVESNLTKGTTFTASLPALLQRLT